MVTSDPDIIRAAEFLVAKHGPRALDVAEKRAAQLQQESFVSAAEIWWQIAERLRDMRKH